MQPGICPQCSPHLAHLREHTQSGIKQIMDAAESMMTECDALPDDLKPYAQALNDICLQVLTEALIESLRRYSELCLQEITRAPIAPNHQTEPDLLERSTSDAI
jgi:hypothetical protein